MLCYIKCHFLSEPTSTTESLGHFKVGTGQEGLLQIEFQHSLLTWDQQAQSLGNFVHFKKPLPVQVQVCICHQYLVHIKALSAGYLGFAAMASKKFKFQNVILDHSRPLGSGSYGNTYQAHCDHLLCAGKHMTPELFESDRESTWGKSRGGKIKKSLISSFQHEIDSLRCICHPHLVQYLGTYIESDSQLPILLMELCRDNLTTYLDEWYESFVYHKQVSLLHDIALALVFLHTHGVVHGNLSSNNVFVVPYPVPLAKVSDYGICRMSSIAKHSTTYYRGNSAYLPPNPLACLQHNAARVDSYSWGILATQVLTQQLPLPPPKPLEQVRPTRNTHAHTHTRPLLTRVH